jgi:hypothetical protein
VGELTDKEGPQKGFVASPRNVLERNTLLLVRASRGKGDGWAIDGRRKSCYEGDSEALPPDLEAAERTDPAL